MRKMTEKQILAKVAAAKRAHDKEESQRAKQAKRSGYDHTPRSFKSTTLGAWQTKNRQFKDCNGKFIFSPISMDATSYGYWYFIKLIKGKVVFNSYRYSVTTGSHQSHGRHLLRTLGINIDLDVECPDGLQRFKEQAIPILYSQLCELEIAIARKGSSIKTNKERMATIKDLNKRIKSARALGAMLTRDDAKRIKQRCIDSETDRLKHMADVRVKNRAIAAATRVVEKNQVVVNINALSME